MGGDSLCKLRRASLQSPRAHFKTSRMERSTTSEKPAADLIREYLLKNPIKLSPWSITQFFENDANVSEEYLEFSLDKLSEEDAEFEEDNKEMLEDLEKYAFLAVPMLRQIPLMTLLTILRETTANVQAFEFLPNFPKPPATRLLDHIFRDKDDKDLSFEEKKLEYEQIATDTSKVLEHLISWREHVCKYIKDLEAFETDNLMDLSDEQKEFINVLLDKSTKTVPQIDAKIEQKRSQIGYEEEQDFEPFYRVMIKEPKFQQMGPLDARNEIRRIFDESNVNLRRIIARIGADKTEKEEISPKMTRKRVSNDVSNESARGAPKIVKKLLKAADQHAGKASDFKIDN
eukprot:NP_493037.1 Uncharacterized protein CELE_Y53C10A.6 [Caenorhabditis elegans]